MSSSSMLANYISIYGLDSITIPTRIRRDSEIDLLPITDIRYITLDNINNLPKNYEIIKYTINNTKASLTVGSFLFKDIYIAIERNKEKIPLKGLIIMNDDDEVYKFIKIIFYIFRYLMDMKN